MLCRPGNRLHRQDHRSILSCAGGSEHTKSSSMRFLSTAINVVTHCHCNAPTSMGMARIGFGFVDDASGWPTHIIRTKILTRLIIVTVWSWPLIVCTSA